MQKLQQFLFHLKLLFHLLRCPYQVWRVVSLIIRRKKEAKPCVWRWRRILVSAISRPVGAFSFYWAVVGLILSSVVLNRNFYNLELLVTWQSSQWRSKTSIATWNCYVVTISCHGSVKMIQLSFDFCLHMGRPHHDLGLSLQILRSRGKVYPRLSKLSVGARWTVRAFSHVLIVNKSRCIISAIFYL